MVDTKKPSNKIFGKAAGSVKNKRLGNPIKPLYYLVGKHFIVIDESIANELNFSSSENMELYFQQEITNEDCIILRPFKVGEVGRKRKEQDERGQLNNFYKFASANQNHSQNFSIQ